MVELHLDLHPPVGSVWKNRKTNHNYVIVGPALYTEENLAERDLVLYKREDGSEPTVYARPLSIFLGGRIENGEAVQRFERIS